MRPSTILAGFLGIVVLGLGIRVSIEHQARLRLAEERHELELRLNQLAEIPSSPNRTRIPQPRSQAFRELLRLRGEIGVLRQETQELEAAREENRLARAANAGPTADYWPQDSWTFAGYASPEATLQTFLWGAKTGNLEAVLAGLTPDMRRGFEAEFKGKSEEETEVRLMDTIVPLQSVHILSRETQADDEVVLSTAFQTPNEIQTNQIVLKRVGNEWKLWQPAPSTAEGL